MITIALAAYLGLMLVLVLAVCFAASHRAPAPEMSYEILPADRISMFELPAEEDPKPASEPETIAFSA